MNNTLITYETVVTKELYIDIDKVIDLAISDIKNKPDSTVSLFRLQCIFWDKIDCYLRKLNLLGDSGELPEEAIDNIYDAFTNRILELYPELDED